MRRSPQVERAEERGGGRTSTGDCSGTASLGTGGGGRPPIPGAPSNRFGSQFEEGSTLSTQVRERYVERSSQKSPAWYDRSGRGARCSEEQCCWCDSCCGKVIVEFLLYRTFAFSSSRFTARYESIPRAVSAHSPLHIPYLAMHAQQSKCRSKCEATTHKSRQLAPVSCCTAVRVSYEGLAKM